MVIYELEQEGKLKLRTYAYLMCPDNPEDPKAEVARIAKDRAMYSGEYFHVVGVKTFLDGVTEAHTAWQNQDYLDEPGYHGNERFNDHDKMVELITAADAEGLSVHVHSEGGGSVSLLPLVEGSHRYFKRVIAQSGSPAFCRSTEQSIACTVE